MSLTLCFVCSQLVYSNTLQTTLIKVRCVNGGVCRGKVVGDLHFRSYFGGKKKPSGVASLHLEIANYFLITVLQKLKWLILLTL
jgi:hypothetical protein